MATIPDVSEAWMMSLPVRVGWRAGTRRWPPSGEHEDRRPEAAAEELEEREVQEPGHLVALGRTSPDELHDLADDDGHPEGEDQLRHVPEAMHPAEAVSLGRRPQQPDRERSHHQSRPEAGVQRDGVGEVGPQHVEGGVGEVEYAHHAEDEGEPARQHEQQHAVDEPVEDGGEDQLEHGCGSGWAGPAAGPAPDDL
jgi:hypothetical protein